MVYSPAQRCLDVLETLADAADGLPLTAIAERLALPKSATHRFVTLLAERGYVRQNEITQHYQLTLRLAALGFRFLAGSNLPEITQPVLDRLAARTGELARLAVVEDGGMTWVAKAQGAHSGLRYDPDIGHEVVLHATAVGRAWLATLPEKQALALVAKHGLGTPSRFGPRAPKTLSAFRARLRETQRRGYGEALEEGAPGVAAVAAVVRPRNDPDAAVVATVSLAGPMSRLTTPRRAALAKEVLAAAHEIGPLWPIRQFQPPTTPVAPASKRHARSA